MRVDLEMVQQATFRMGLEFLNDDETPIDISTVTIRLDAVHSIDASTFTTAGTILDAPNGLAEVVVGSDVTAALRSGLWSYDLFVLRPGVLEDEIPISGSIQVAHSIGGPP